MRKITTKGASWDSVFLAAVKLATIVSGMLQTKLLARGLSLDDNGTYSQLSIVTSIGAAFLLLGFGDVINYFYNRKGNDQGPSERMTIVNTVFFLEIVIGLLFAVVVILGRGLLANYFSNAALKLLLPVVAIRPMLENLLCFYQILYVSAGRAKVIAFRNIVIAGLKLLATYLAVFIFRDVVYVLIAMVALDLLQLLFLKVLFARDEFPVQPQKKSCSQIRTILAYGIPMGLFAITNALSREMDKLVIGRLTDTQTLAVYASCSRILPFDIVVVSFATVLIPYIMRYVSGAEKDKAAKLFSNYMKIGYYSVWILGVAVLITSEQVISLLYTEEYLRGTSVFVIYVVDSMIKFASMHLILTAGGKTNLIMVYSLGAMLLNLVLNILLYAMVGMTGPAWATLISTAVYTFLILRSSIKLIGVEWKDVFDVKDMLLFGALLAITGVVFAVINRLLLDGGMHKYTAMLISAGGFGFTNLLLNFRRIWRALKATNDFHL